MQANDVECERLIENSLRAVQPQNMGISSDRETVISLLNRWRAACAEPLPANWGKGLADEWFSSHLSEELKTRIERENFVKRDATHLRSCIWYETVAKRVAEETGSDDLARAINLFYYAVRNIAPLQESEKHFPLDPFEMAMFGRGHAEDRAWLFASLLRPLRIDACIIRPSEASQESAEPKENSSEKEPSERSTPWLVGVVIQGDIFLFDPSLGMPIPADSADPKSPLPNQPATLSEAIENPKLLESLDLDGAPYEIHSDDLKNLKVELIGNSSLWAARTMLLQETLAGDQAATVFDGLQDGLWGEGIVSRIATAGSGIWTVENIGIWPYPETQLNEYDNMAYEDEKELEQRRRPFDVPVPIVGLDQETSTFTFEQPQRRQLSARNAQLRGDFSTAIKNFLSIRLWGGAPPFRDEQADDRRDPGQPFQQGSRMKVVYLSLGEFLARERIPPEAHVSVMQRIPRDMMIIHSLAAVDASFWGAMSQFEQRKYEAAAESFESFLRQFPETYWTPLATNLWAISLAEAGHVEKALSVIKESVGDNPLSRGKRILAGRWQAILDARSKQNDKTNE